MCDERLLSCTNQEMDIRKSLNRDVKNQPGRGCVCTLTSRTVRRMVRLATACTRITAGELQRLVESWGQNVSKTTIRRHLHPHKLFWRVARKKTLVSINHKLK